MEPSTSRRRSALLPLALCAALLALASLGGARAAEPQAYSIDGLYNVGKGLLCSVAVAPHRYVFVIASSSTVAPDDPLYIVPEYGLGIGRPGYPNLVDSYAISGNYTTSIGDGNTTSTTINTYNNLQAPLYPVTRNNSGVPASAPSFAGYYESKDGWRMTCLQTLHDKGALVCMRSKLQANGTVTSKWSLVVQRKSAPSTAYVFSNDGDLTYILAKDRSNLTIWTPGSKPTLVVTLFRKSIAVDPQSPPLTGLYRSNPAAQIMVCGSPPGSPAAALCVGLTNLGPGRMFVFNVVETQAPSGVTTEQLTSVGFFTSRWSDAAGTAKLQFFPGAPDVVAVGYRTAEVQTLTGTWNINGVPVTCSGGLVATTCVGAVAKAGGVSSITMTAIGVGNGNYNVNYVMQTPNAVATYAGMVTVSLDGMSLSPALPNAVPKRILQAAS